MSQQGTSGFGKLSVMLGKLEMKAQSKAVAQAAGFAMTPVRTAVKRNAPTGTVGHYVSRIKIQKRKRSPRKGGKIVAPGYMKRSIQKRVFRWRDGSGVSVIVGPESAAFYGSQFVELGAYGRSGNGFMLKSYRQTKYIAEDRFAKKLAQIINKQAAK